MRQSTANLKPTGIIGISIISLLALFFASTGAQMKTMKIQSDGEIFLLSELGAVIIDSENGPKVEMVMPPDNRAKKFKSVDLQKGDIIKMLNGKSLKSSAHLKEIYEKMEVGDEIKFGILRGKSMKIESLTKASQDELPGKMMVMIAPGEGASAEMALLDAGLLLKNVHGKIIVEEVISNIADAVLDNKPSKGDELIKFQGHALSSPDQLSEICDKVKAGDKVELIFVHDGKEFTVNYTKPSAEDFGIKKHINISK